ncbi:efflux RND transporter periplasmic adaptor subunit [candidate division KSB1 bacterium]
MKKIGFIIVLIIVGLFIVRGIINSIEKSKEKVYSIPDIQKEQGIPVEVKKINTSTIRQSKIYSGTLKGIEQADATSKTQERVEKIRVKVGKKVRKGQIIASLNKSNPSAGYKQAKFTLELAEKEIERIRALYKEGAVSVSQLDQQENAYKLAKSNFETVEELLNIRAPISGVVTDIFIVEGQTVNPGQPVTRIAKFQQLELEVKVGEKDIRFVSEGQEALIKTANKEDNHAIGKVDRIALSADPMDRNFTVWITISNNDLSLKPGLFATAELIFNERKDVIAADKLSLGDDNGSVYVYVVNNELICEKRNIVTGIADSDKMEVTSGLEIGEQVVVRGHSKLKGGEKVLIVD